MISNSWWRDVSGPSRFLDEAAKIAANQKSSILSLPASIPFEEDFYSILAERVEQELLGQPVTVLENISGSISDYFMNVYCKKELRANFRPKPGFTAAKFLAQSPTAVMHGRGFIVRISNSEELQAWTSFTSEYVSALSREIMPAVFFLCIQGEERPRTFRGLKMVDYRDYSSHFDAYAYCAIRASDVNESILIKEYLADLAASLSDENVEQAEKAIYIYREFLNDPAAFAVKHFDSVDIDRNELDKVVWESQLKCIFPYVEKYRCAFVEKHEKRLAPHIGVLKDPVGEPYVSTRDIELGTLFYMVKNGMLALDRDEYEELKVFYNARNNLAHMNVLPMDDIRALVS